MTDEEAITICARITTPLYLPDNRLGRCSECGWRIQFRPHAPRGRKVCMECAGPLIEDPDNRVVVPQQMLDDAKAYFRKRQH